jgi:hypothetical protein
MAIRSEKNLYPGINPHLNSALQRNNAGWQSFHADHITHIRESVDNLLPDSYYVASEASLQIGTYDEDLRETVVKTGITRPDVTIFDRGSSGKYPSSPSSMTPTLTIPVAATFDDEEEITGVVVYYMEAGEFPGKPVTRIELLSPANKPPGSYYKPYMRKRMETLSVGIRLVEIDYLHQRRPLITDILSYIDRQENALPYHIIVSDPRPTVDEGPTDVYSFGLFQPPPRLTIPLEGKDSITLDFGALYTHTFESSRLFREVLVDYTQLPANFEAYSAADQEAIRSQMAQIAANQPPA